MTRTSSLKAEGRGRARGLQTTVFNGEASKFNSSKPPRGAEGKNPTSTLFLEVQAEPF